MTYPGPGCGVVFKLNPGTGQQTVLYTFTDGADGAQPWGGLVQDSSGNLYGAAAFGGSNGAGVIYKVDPAGHQTVLHSFNYTDGANPTGDLLLEVSGTLVGTTVTGGNLSQCYGQGCGVVFRLNPGDQLKVLRSFAGPTADAANPTHGLIRDKAGNLYGTTENGGPRYCFNYEFAEAVLTFIQGCGVVFKLDPAGKETQLYQFGGFFSSDGSDPRTSLIRDAAGNFYGTTFDDGLYGAGTVFKLDPTGHETVLYNFQGGTDGANPWGGLARDAAGNLYGTTNHAGGPCYCGTVFELDWQGNYTVLHTFAGTDGQYPEAPLLLVGNVLYGITSGGGTLSDGNFGTGVIFEITLP